MRLGLSRPRPAGLVVSLLRGDRGQVFVYLAGARGGPGRISSLPQLLHFNLFSDLSRKCFGSLIPSKHLLK